MTTEKTTTVASMQPFVMRCRDCGETGSDWYWHNAKGQKMKQPRCSRCHEVFISRYDTKEECGYLDMSGQSRRVCGVHRRGVYEYREEE
jgi:hypothetical protein